MCPNEAILRGVASFALRGLAGARAIFVGMFAREGFFRACFGGVLTNAGALLLGVNFLQAQVAQPRSFEVLRMAPTARIAMLGGRTVSLADRDPVVAAYNPGLLSDSLLRRPSLSVGSYLGGITFGTAAYASTIKNVDGYVHGGIQYLSYGNLNGADAFGNTTPSFTANELVVYAGAGRRFGRLTFGMNLKFAYSTLEQTSSTGLGVDVGARYDWPSQGLTVGLALRNLGSQLSAATRTGVTYAMPTTVEIGLTQKLKYAPIRYSITLSDLQRGRIPAESDQTKAASFGENLTRRLTVAVELLPAKSVVVAISYNHNRRVELRSQEQGFGLAGFGVGFGVRIRRFHLDYCYSGYHAAGGANLVGISFLLPRKS